MAFAAVIDLSTLNGSNGGVAIRGLASDMLGSGVSSVGDVNGDGYADFVLGARGWGSDDYNPYREGAAYVVFGGAAGFPTNFSVSGLNGHNGFVVHGSDFGGLLGWRVAGLGDINNDGLSDLILGSNDTGDFSGAAYVIYGRNVGTSGDYAAAYSAADIGGSLAGSAITGSFHQSLGYSVSGIGDINHDGFADFAVGVLGLGSDFFNGVDGTGGAFVIYGRAAPLPAAITEADLDGTLGFKLVGSGGAAGLQISDAGDINGDGIADMVISATNADSSGGHWAGSAYVVFGRDAAVQGAFAASVNLADLNGTNGFRVDGATPFDFVGQAVSSIGDVNGDGFDDLAIAASDGGDSFDGQAKGAVYIVYGRNAALSGGFAPVISTAALTGAVGFRIEGVLPGDYIGQSVSGLGDVNGDGLDDFIIGATQLKNGTAYSQGGAYVVFGKSGGFGAGLDLSTLNGTNGFYLKGGIVSGKAGLSVHAAGDLNGDGVGDILVGAPYASALGGLYGNGFTYIIYGQGAGPITQTGGTGDDLINGGPAGDTLNGGDGKDTINGLGGDDVINGDDGNDKLSGGAGADLIRGGDGGDTIYGGNGVDDLDGGLGADKLYGDGGDDIIVGAAGNDYMYGGADNDSLTGNAGNDYLDGGAGADAMAGGADNDVYIVDDIGDTITENLGEGSDIVRAFISFTLGDNLETLQLQGSGNLDGTGNALANNIQGNSGNNTLSGGAGVDTINGNDGDDIIVGGLNNDLLRGGLGADTFRILEESINTAVLETDTIYDFSSPDGDRLDLSQIDANTLIAGDQAFVLVGAFNHAGGQMTMTFSGGQTLIRLDVDGDNTADYQLKINGDVRAESGGWLL